MLKITANDAKSNFDEELEAMKADYIKHCFEYAKEDDFILIVAVLGQSQLPQIHLK